MSIRSDLRGIRKNFETFMLLVREIHQQNPLFFNDDFLRKIFLELKSFSFISGLNYKYGEKFNRTIADLYVKIIFSAADKSSTAAKWYPNILMLMESGLWNDFAEFYKIACDKIFKENTELDFSLDEEMAFKDFEKDCIVLTVLIDRFNDFLKS